VTGAFTGIGAAGYDIALNARRGERLEALAEEICLRCGVEDLAITADLVDSAAADH
jgi:short-subunit dehydrogenase